MKSADLVGAWREVGREAVAADGTVTPGPVHVSQIVYAPDGFMAVVNTPPGRARVAETRPHVNLDHADAAARAEAARGVVAYAGHYEVEGDLVRHHIYSSLNPNVVGDVQLRVATLAGDDLTLGTPPEPDGSSFRIRWRRAGKMT